MTERAFQRAIIKELRRRDAAGEIKSGGYTRGGKPCCPIGHVRDILKKLGMEVLRDEVPIHAHGQYDRYATYVFPAACLSDVVIMADGGRSGRAISHFADSIREGIMTERDEIIESIARTLFVTAYAELSENAEHYAPDLQADEGQCAGAGEDWFNTVTDETPESATVQARTIAEAFEADNGRTPPAAFETWLTLHAPSERDKCTLKAFGHRLAMVALGTGVGLWDDCGGLRGHSIICFDVASVDYCAWDF